MAFLTGEGTEYLVEKLSDSKNIKINGNNYGYRVNSVVDKLVEKADNITKAVEQEVINDSHMFKVGTGNVDISSDVEDGFGKIGLKGKTYQNVFNDFRIEPGLSSQYFTVECDEIKCNKPIVTEDKIKIKYHNSLVQLNKVYTLVFYIYKNTLQRDGQETENYNVSKFNLVSYNSGVYFITKGKTGLVKVKLQQPTTVTGDGKPYLEVYGTSVGELEISHPVLLEGDYTNDPNLPLEFFEGIIGVGDKSKNLYNYKTSTNGFTISAETGLPTSRSNRFISDFIEVEQGMYVFLKVRSPFQFKNLWAYDHNKEPVEKIGIESFQQKTFRIQEGIRFIRFPIGTLDDQITTEEMIKSVEVLVSSCTDEYEPYYDGHKISMMSHGINLWDLKNKSFSGFIEHATGNLHIPDCQNRTSDFIRIKPGITYTYMTTVDVNCQDHPVSWNAVAWYDENKNYIVRSVKTGEKMGVDTIIYTLTSPTNAAYARVGSRYLESEFAKATFSEGIISEHSLYQEEIMEILLDEPLMRLPNGVCDEITMDGKLIRRVGKYVFDGLDAWNKTEILTNTTRYSTGSILTNKLKARTLAKCYCDMVPNMEGNKDVFHARFSGGTPFSQFMIWIEPSKLTDDSNTGFMNWLKSNPVTVYYELAEPIVTELPAPYLRIFKDGHLNFNTLVAPESNHVVQLNKSAQIERSIREVQSLDGRVGQLESFYDDMMLETSHKLNLLTFDFEYMKERNGE